MENYPEDAAELERALGSIGAESDVSWNEGGNSMEIDTDPPEDRIVKDQEAFHSRNIVNNESYKETLSEDLRLQMNNLPPGLQIIPKKKSEMRSSNQFPVMSNNHPSMNQPPNIVTIEKIYRSKEASKYSNYATHMYATDNNINHDKKQNSIFSAYQGWSSANPYPSPINNTNSYPSSSSELSQHFTISSSRPKITYKLI